MTDQLSAELEYSQQLVAPLLAALQALSKHVGEAGGQPDALRPLLANVQLVASIFYSLNSPGLTEVRLQHVGPWRQG
jgi:hypothetical protein